MNLEAINLPGEIGHAVRCLSNTTGLSEGAVLRLALCLSMTLTERPEAPPEEANPYTVSISQVFGRDELLYLALLEAKRIKDEVPLKQRGTLMASHFIRGVLRLKTEVKSIGDLTTILKISPALQKGD